MTAESQTGQHGTSNSFLKNSLEFEQGSYRFVSSISQGRAHEVNPFFVRCNSWQIKPFWRVLVDSVLVYIIPVGFSGFLYIKIASALRSQTKRVNRNRNLSICFFTSWCLWVVCWAPKIIISLMQIPKHSAKFSLGETGNKVMVYLFLHIPQLQMLFSQLNPFLYLILFKKFQQRVMGVLKLGLCTRIEDQIQNKTPKTPERDAKARRPVFGLRKFCVTLVFGLSFILLVGNIGVFSYGEANSEENNYPKTQKLLRATTTGFKLTTLDLFDTFNAGKVLSAREKCSINEATFNFAHKRCYFVLEHSSPGLNLTQQMETCGNHGAVLSYPRKYIEITFMWDFFETQQTKLSHEMFFNISLHAGFVRETPVLTRYPRFTSADGSLVIDSSANKEMFQDFLQFRSLFEDYSFMGPAICYSKAKQLDECLPRFRKRFSVCSISL